MLPVTLEHGRLRDICNQTTQCVMTDDSADRVRRWRERQQEQGRKRLDVPIPARLLDHVRRYAEQEGLSVPQAVAQLLAEALKRR